MSSLGKYTPEKFAADYPLNFGSEVRGAWLEAEHKRVGLLVAHYKEGGEVCGCSVYWDWHPDKEHQLYKEDPPTITPEIVCDCGLHGTITKGIWQT